MKTPLQIVMTDVPASPEMRKTVEEAATALERYYDRITSCRVSIARPDAKHRSGGQFDVHISILLPGRKEITVSRHAADEGEREHLAAAVRGAFAQARRQLQDAVRKMRGDTKAHTKRPPTETT
jgi:ribosome-associated translation inhibitor RaiA